MEKRVAVVDLGSNTVRMIIMQINADDSYRIVDEAKEMIRLNEGMGLKKVLQPEPMERALRALKSIKKIIEFREVDRIIAVTTAAIRNAINGEQFLLRIQDEVGIEFEVIAGEKEAYYGYVGVINTLDVEDCVIIDIGGGSTEISLVKNRVLINSVSLPYGAVILTEEFLGKENISKDRLANLEKHNADGLKNIKWLEEAKGLTVVGLGGTIRTLAKIHKYKIGFPLNNLHNLKINFKEVISIYKEIIGKELEERVKIPGVSKERADIITGGLVPVKVLMEYLDSSELLISGSGIREGIFYEYYLNRLNYREMKVADVLNHSIINTLKNYNVNLQHSNHVKSLALNIFDQTKSVHGFGDVERKLLSIAALLHDIGSYIDYYNHHRHGFYLTLNSKINGLCNEEKVLCAFLVAFHREADFKEEWKSYKLLINKKAYDNIKKLSIFLKIAEKLDRREYSNVTDVKCEVSKKVVRINVIALNNSSVEIEAALKNKRDYYRAFKKELVII